MSGIFKGDSIYKNGGGAGGYKDGGELIDGDFIKVENNTISEYTNDNRNVLNFYYEVKNEEQISSIIEVTNNTPATVNVFRVVNGLFVYLGTINGNTLNSGSTYNINVEGNNFDIQETTNPVIQDEFVLIAGELVKVIRIGNMLWTDYLSRLITGNMPNGYPWCRQTGDIFSNGSNYIFYAWDYAKNLVGGNFKLPDETDIENLNNILMSYGSADPIKSTSKWHNNKNGTNASGFGAWPTGRMNAGGTFIPVGQSIGYSFNIWGKNVQEDRNKSLYLNWNEDIVLVDNAITSYYLPIRLCSYVS